MNISHEDRLKLLEAHNELRRIIRTMHECHDIWLSDVDKLERLECLLHAVMKFVPEKDDDGRSLHYADWVLAEEEEEA